MSVSKVAYSRLYDYDQSVSYVDDVVAKMICITIDLRSNDTTKVTFTYECLAQSPAVTGTVTHIDTFG
jgi:hypothetical protein